MTTNWNIPHNERHQFLKFDARDNDFYNWCAWFDIKQIPYEVGGGGNLWTIYKHMYFVEDFSTGKIGRCCPMSEEM